MSTRATMSTLGHSRHSEPDPKSTFVRYAPNSDHSTAEFVCPLSAMNDRLRGSKQRVYGLPYALWLGYSDLMVEKSE